MSQEVKILAVVDRAHFRDFKNGLAIDGFIILV